jgi:hypothetical protein
MDEKKKQWQKPVLIVIGRGRTEENVIMGCKTSLLSGPNEAGQSGNPKPCDHSNTPCQNLS